MTAAHDPATPFLRLQDVGRRFRRRAGVRGEDRSRWFDALADVRLDIRDGTILAIVGASGAGKSTLGRVLSLVDTPTVGDLLVDGRELSRLNRGERRDLRRAIQVVHQDPFEALDPRFTVARSIAEALPGRRTADSDARVETALREVELEPGQFAGRLPDELSGGQRQRVAIARAIVNRPRLIVADEPVAALDVSIRAGVLRLFDTIRRDLGTSIALITHDLGVARAIADEIVVMHHGRIVERGDTDTVLDNPQDDYTRLLLRSAPRLRWVDDRS